jgi:putative chitinase
MTITPAVLKRIAPNARASIIEQAAPIFDEWFPRLGINTELRQAHFLAQTAHESDSFRTTTEYASGAAYEGRVGLGNTQRGDGKRFKGRGLIQCTGRSNYRAFTAWMRDHDRSAPDFEAEPETLALFPWAALSALWFWSTRGLNDLADRDDLRAVTKRINGGFNGLEDRARFLTRAKVAVEPPRAISQPATLRLGDQGDRVRTLQANLRALGFYVATDGDFGPVTELAVIAFQTGHNLKPDGVVGPMTAAAIVQALSNMGA